MTGVTLSSDVDQIVCVLRSQAGLGFVHVIDDWSFRNEFVLGVGECDQHPNRDVDNDRWSRSSRMDDRTSVLGAVANLTISICAHFNAQARHKERSVNKLMLVEHC